MGLILFSPMQSSQVISQSKTFVKSEQLKPNGDETGKLGAIIIKGSNITVDFGGSTIRGTSAETEPNERKGTGIVVLGKNVTIKNLNVHGYKIGLAGWDADGLKIENCDFSYNWKQRLQSTRDRENTADWMSFHNNENHEWLRFGAAIYLSDCSSFEVKNVKAIGGQCGLMMNRCINGKIWNNNFSFLSAIGVGLYRSSQNRIMHNRIDFCVRGYSHGIYNRGQDSAGILIYEQSNKNTFAYNSVTHGGDGFFLWAGQTTMDSGEGGCNDNILYGNDFSHAPTNAIEVTFSRNKIVNNLLLEDWHGIWGGYSYETEIVGNVFGMNGDAIAIEHGQDNNIKGNIFRYDNNALRIWMNESQDPNWGYPKHRDTKSHDYLVDNNVFFGIAEKAFIVTRTQDFAVTNNFIKNVGTILEIKDVENFSFSGNELWTDEDASLLPFGLDVLANHNKIVQKPTFVPPPSVMQTSGSPVLTDNASKSEYLKRFDVGWDPFVKPVRSSKSTEEMSPDELRLHESASYYVAPLKGGQNPFIPSGDLRGRRYILVDEWGPYDFRSPRLWARSFPKLEGNKVKFDVLGPEGKWKLISATDGITLSQTSGEVGDSIIVTFGQSANDVEIVLEYIGESTVDYRGIETPAGEPVRFGYSKFVIPMEVEISYWNYDLKTQDPRTEIEAFAKVVAGDPVYTQKLNELNLAWGGSPGPGVKDNHFTTKTKGNFTVKPGEYELVITSDDGVRVWIEDELILDDWTYHAPKTDTIRLNLSGKTNFRIDHFELDGYSTLKLEIRKVN